MDGLSLTNHQVILSKYQDRLDQNTCFCAGILCNILFKKKHINEAYSYVKYIIWIITAKMMKYMLYYDAHI